jgi:hypothetical protein
MYDDGVVKRFQAERQLLAMMDHPDGDPRFDTLVGDAQKGAASPVGAQ